MDSCEIVKNPKGVGYNIVRKSDKKILKSRMTYSEAKKSMSMMIDMQKDTNKKEVADTMDKGD